MPLIRSGILLGVLDLDSPELGRFDAEDVAGLATGVELLLAHSDMSTLVGDPRPLDAALRD